MSEEKTDFEIRCLTGWIKGSGEDTKNKEKFMIENWKVDSKYQVLHDIYYGLYYIMYN